MKLTKLYTTSLFTLIILSASTAFGQNNTSPYSMLGIGDIRNSYFDYSTGMGNAGISLSSHRNIYDANPASLTALDDHFFSFELATNFSSVNYLANSITTPTRSNQMQVQRFVMGLKIKPFWGISMGLKQFSSSNYEFTGLKNVIGTNDYLSTNYDGSGGINQVFVSNAFSLGKHLSVGLNSSFLFGSMQQAETLNSGAIVGSQLNTTNITYYHHLYFQGGMQYKTHLSKKLDLSIGAIASNKTTLNGTHSVALTEGDPNVSAPTSIIKDSVIGTTYFNLPVMYGGGISLTFNNKLTVAGDYKAQDWNNVHNINGGGNDYTLRNSKNYSAGIQYAPKKKLLYNNQLYEVEKYSLQAGAYYNTEYIDIHGQQISDKGISLGVGINSLKTSLGYNFNFQLGSRGTTVNNLIKENYFNIGIIITYRDLWRMRKSY